MRTAFAPPTILAAVLGAVAIAGSSAGAAAPPPPAPAAEITVYAAASLQDALQVLAPGCESEAGARFVFNFGGSNDLARQIVAANKADVFFSADDAWMDHVAKAGLVDEASRRTLLSNRLVVVVPRGSEGSITGAASLAAAPVRRVALADPDAVPAGRYAKAWLEKAGIWDQVRDKVAPFPDVRSTLSAVEAGMVDAGVVYRTDAAIARRARVAFEVAEAEGPRITYPVAALVERPRVETARRVVACLAGARARGVFERFGFVVLDATP